MASHIATQRPGPDLYENILVGTDGSDYANAAVALAATLAAKAGKTLTIVSVLTPAPGYDNLAFPSSDVDQLMEQTLQEALQRAVRIAEERGATASQRLERGPTAPTICKLAAAGNHDLVVVGSHGHSVSYSTLLGSVSDRLASICPTDVLIVRRDVRPAHLLVATDGSAAASVAVRRAADLAAWLHGELTVLTVDEPSHHLALLHRAGVAAEEHTRRALAAHHEEVLSDAVRLAAEAGITAQARRETGPAAQAIAQAAQSGSFDLVVVGSHGHSPVLNHLLLGSVSDKLIHVCPVNVLVVR